MRKEFIVVVFCVLCVGCKKNSQVRTSLSMVGTWRLVSGTIIEKGDTTVTRYTNGTSFIKIINDSHFAFLLHDLHAGKNSSALYSSGGGKYELIDSTYTEHLEYCSDRQWEGHDFVFTVSIKGDTLIQRGKEEVESAGISRLNIEKYCRQE